MHYLNKIRSVPRRNLVFYGILLLIFSLIILYLLNAELPWKKGITARKLAGKTIKPEHYAVTGLWYGSWISLFTLPVLAAIGRLSLRRLSPNFTRLRAGLGKDSSPAFLVLAAIAISIAALQLFPRLDNSLWGDEDYTTRRAIIGQWERNAEDQLAFRKAKWTDTLFYYKTPNNHVLFSILARIAHLGYNDEGNPANLHFKESLLRTPAFIFGLGSVISLGYLIAVIGYRRAAIAAMFLLALHPWYLRHACEARGYAIALCLAPLALTFLIKALRRGRWRYWSAFGAAEFLLFYAYPGTIYILVPLSAGALSYIWITKKDLARGDKLTLTSRWFSSCTFAAIPAIILMAPNLPQMQAYFARARAQGELSMNWLWDNLCYMGTGMPWNPWEANNPNCLFLAETPAISLTILALFYGFILLGALRLSKSGCRWLLFTLCIPYLLMLSHSLIGNVLLYQWYAIIHLPFALCLASIGLECISSTIQSVRLRTQAGLLLLAAFLIPYSLHTKAQRTLQRDQSVEPLLESVRITRKVLNPLHPDVDNAITAQFCMITPGYDPTSYIIKRKYSPEPEKKLHSLMQMADETRKPLHVNIGQPALARLEWPELMTILEDQALFQALDPLYGLQSGSSRYIFRYLGKASLPINP
ncbi:MAG: glycosyltransferase family 39 protein [Verrucomicrobiaceae bacterium]|nr:glycosyltransferase family 39 protein [Verrucomicrobiaceae bacterium]